MVAAMGKPVLMGPRRIKARGALFATHASAHHAGPIMPIASKERFRPTPNFRERRRRGMALVKMVDSAGHHRQIMVCDVSAKGISAAAQGTPPAPDEMVCIHLPDGRSAWGLVRWVRRNLFGVEFAVTAAD
jgi:hypothetical protein